MTQNPDLVKMLLEFLDNLDGTEDLPREGLRLKAIELLSKVTKSDPKGKTQDDGFDELLKRARKAAGQ